MSETLTFTAAATVAGSHAPVAAAAGAAKGKTRRFNVMAYSGGPISQYWSDEPIYVDLQGMSWPSKQRPVLLQHDPGIDSIVGQTTDIRVDNPQALAALAVDFDVMSPVDDVGEVSNAAKVVSLADQGFQWQASIGADVLKSQRIGPQETATVNGRTVNGPARIIRQSRLREVSICSLGADDTTNASLAAAAALQGGSQMSKANGSTQAPAVVTTDNTPAPIAASAPAPAAAPAAAASTPATAPAPAAAPAAPAAPVQASNLSDDDVNRIAAAVAATALAAQRGGRPVPPTPAIHTAASTSEPRTDILQAALCRAGGLRTLEKDFDDKTLTACDRQFRRGCGPQEVLIQAARANGYVGRETFKDSDCMREILRAAFATHDIQDILSATVNKFLLQGFLSTDQSWRKIATTRNVNDFKDVTGYQLTGSFEFVPQAETGEFKMATAGTVSYKNRARTYGIGTNFSREQMINDDLSALTGIPARIGRGASLNLNTVFWTTWLANSYTQKVNGVEATASFFSSGNKNLLTGASSAFGVESVTAAEVKFLEQTDYDGKPLGIIPKFLLVPPALNTPALTLLRSTEIRDTTSSTKYPTANPHMGKYEPIVTPYLSNPTISGYSRTAWTLMADPADLALIEVCFLNGIEQPTIEQAEMDFSTLGIQFRGFWDHGTTLVEPRAGVRADGV
jgi:hypothetical protein